MVSQRDGDVSREIGATLPGRGWRRTSADERRRLSGLSTTDSRRRHTLAPTTARPKLKLARISRQSTIAANIQMIENGERVLNAASAERSLNLRDLLACSHPDAHIAIGDPGTEVFCSLLILLTPNHCRACRHNENMGTVPCAKSVCAYDWRETRLSVTTATAMCAGLLRGEKLSIHCARVAHTEPPPAVTGRKALAQQVGRAHRIYVMCDSSGPLAHPKRFGDTDTAGNAGQPYHQRTLVHAAAFRSTKDSTAADHFGKQWSRPKPSRYLGCSPVSIDAERFSLLR